MTVQSVERAIDILELFLSKGPSLSLKEISSSLSQSKSTTHGLIKTLEKRGFIEQNLKDHEYRLGIKVFELGNKYGDTLDISKLSSPHLQSLVDEFNETVHLFVLSGSEGVYIDIKEGARALRMYSQVGKRAPLYCTAVGKAILAFLPDDDIESILAKSNLIPYTSKTITDIKKIREHLQDIKSTGYAVVDEEVEIGLRCVAAPVFNHQGEAIASISCAGPTIRFDEERIRVMGESLKVTAHQISKSLGFTYY